MDLILILQRAYTSVQYFDSGYDSIQIGNNKAVIKVKQ